MVLPRSRAGAAAVLLVLAALPACSMPSFLRVADPKDGVTVKSLTADVAFGSEAAETAPPARSSVRTLLETLLPEEGEIAQAQERQDFPSSPPSRLPPLLLPCPSADSTSFPETEIARVVRGTPKTGRYRWKQSGTVTVTGFGQVPLFELGLRVVRNVQPTLVGFTYEYEQSHVAGREVWQVEVRTGTQPQANGVYLRSLALYQPRSETPMFEFEPPELVAPKLFSLPITNESVAVTAVDPANLVTFTLQGEMAGSLPERFDACGETLDAWRFKGTARVVQSLADQSQAIRSTRYDMLFAPQLGGLFVGDHVVTSGSFGAFQYTADARTTIGGLTPHPET